MKRTLVLAAIFVMAIGTAAYARGHFNGGHGMGGGQGMGGCGYYNNGGVQGAGPNCGSGNCGGIGMGNGGDYGMGMGMGNGQAPVESAVKSDKDAEALVQKYLTENYKGYKIAKSESFTAPRGTAYKVTVNDASGNSFIFHVNPWGSVRGPFLSK